MVSFDNTLIESGFDSSPELIALCEKVYLMGRRSILDAQLEGRRRSNKKMGRPKGSKDKKKHGRDLTTKYKYILFNTKFNKDITDMERLRTFAQKVRGLEVIDKKDFQKLKAEAQEITNANLLRYLGGISGFGI